MLNGLRTDVSAYVTQQQELSYRKQIVRNLRTQYVHGIYRPKYYTVTLKTKLSHSRSMETEPLDRSYTTYY